MGRFGDIELDDLELVGHRVTLRPFRSADADYVLEQMQDPRMPYSLSGIPQPYTAADATDFVTAIGQRERRAGTGLTCAVVETATGTLGGAAELRLPKPGRPRAAIGYWVGTHARGRGLAADATRVLAEWAHARAVARVELEIDIENLASAHTALAAGFRYDGTMRGVLELQEGRRDVAHFGRLASDAGAPIPPAYPALPNGELSDGVVALRCTTGADAESWSEQEGDALSVASGFTGAAPPAEEIRRVAARAGLDWVLGLILTMTVVDVATGSFAGSLRVRLSGPPRIGSIGYGMHPAFRGRGYTSRALQLLIGWAFDAGGLARLELGAKTENVASQKAALSAGFAPDGVMAGRLRRPDGTFADEVRFALTRPLVP